MVGKKQFSAHEVDYSRKLAHISLHVKRAMRRIKEFQILSGTIPITLTSILSKICIFCCHLTNFTCSLHTE